MVCKVTSSPPMNGQGFLEIQLKVERVRIVVRALLDSDLLEAYDLNRGRISTGIPIACRCGSSREES